MLGSGGICVTLLLRQLQGNGKGPSASDSDDLTRPFSLTHWAKFGSATNWYNSYWKWKDFSFYCPQLWSTSLFLHEVQVATSPLFGRWLESELCPKLPCLVLDEARRSQKLDFLKQSFKIGLIFFFGKLFYGKPEFIIDKGLLLFLKNGNWKQSRMWQYVCCCGNHWMKNLLSSTLTDQ